MLNSIDENSLRILKTENKVNNNMMAFRANDNKLEKSPKRDEFNKDKKQRGVIITLGSILTAITTIGIICYSKGKSAKEVNKSFTDKIKDGWKLLWGKGEKAAEDGAKKAEDEALKAAEKAKKAEENAAREAEEASKRAEEEAAKKLEEENKIKAREYEKLFNQKDNDIESIKSSIKIIAEIDDPEVAEIIYYDLAKKNIPLKYDTFIYMPNRFIYPANAVMEKALETASPLEKERLLKKAADILINNKRVHSFEYDQIARKLSEITKELQKLYQTEGVDFRYKELDKDISKTIMDILKENSYEYKKAAKDIPFELDYNLYQKLLKESEEYVDPFLHKKEDPMRWGSHIKSFLSDIFPKLIREESNTAAKESLYEKYLKLILNEHGKTQYNEKYFATLLEMKNLLYKGGKEAAEKSGLKKYEFVQDEINKVMDEYIFSKFKLTSVESPEEMLELAKRVIDRSNSRFLNFFPDDVTHNHIARALREMWAKTGSEKYFKEALDIFEKNNDIKGAANFVDTIDIFRKERSPEFNDFISKKQKEYKTIIEKSINDILKKFEKTSLKESFDKMLSSNKEFRDAIDTIAKENGNSAEQIREKMMSGDYDTISSVIKDAIFKSDSEGLMIFKESKPNPIWDDIINYIGNIGEVVKDPAELEKLKNIRVRAIGAKVVGLKKTNPDLADAYKTLLKKDLTDIIYGTSENGLTKEAVNQDLIDELADRIGDLIYVPNYERTIYNAIEYCMEKPSNVELDTWKKLRETIKERLKFEDWSDEDFYEYFKRFFGGGRESGKTIHQSKESAIDVLNKYLDGNKLSPDSSPEEIKAAYRKLALKYHPDKCVQNGEDPEVNKQIFQEIGNAYDALKKSMKI